MKAKQFIALLTLTALLASCGGGSASTDTTTAQQSETTAAPVEDENARESVKSSLPEGLDFKGDTVTILTRSESTYLNEFDASEQNGDIINDTIYSRNQYVSETLNCELELISRDGAYGQHTAFTNTVVNEVMAGDDSYDIISFYAYAAPLLTSQGVLMNLHDVENLDLTKPWWHQDFVEKAEIYGNLYSIPGDICISTVSLMSGIFFNQRLADEYLDVNPYELVDENKWTIDLFKSLVRDLFIDVNGNTEADETDIFGWELNAFDIIANGCGLTYTKKTSDGGYELDFYNDRSVDIIEGYAQLLEAQGVFYKYNYYNDDNFKNGLRVFYPAKMNLTDKLRDMKDEFGILPAPKYDESQEMYHSVINDNYSQIMVPSTCKDDALVGAWLELAGEYSYKKLIPAYFETAMKGKYLRDNDSARMFDLIVAGAYYDFAVINTVVLDNPVFVTRSSMQHHEGKNFASFYAAKEDSMKSKLESLLVLFKES